jgi:uncharacterized membrane protein YuzA (DUF378 family)
MKLEEKRELEQLPELIRLRGKAARTLLKVLLFLGAINYLLSAYVAMDFDPARWGARLRLFSGVIMVLVEFAAIIAMPAYRD